ncbi:MAG: MFS transporter [Coriobacteriia bacterium]
MSSVARRLVPLLGAAGFVVMADSWVVSPILPAISHSLGVQPISAGILIAAYMLPFGVFQLAFGPLADRFGKTRVILLTFTAFVLATAVCAAGTSLTQLTIFRALTGLFAAATMPVSLALIGDVVPMENRQQSIGTFLGITSLGQALSLGIGGAIANYFDWRGVFAVYAVAAAVIGVALWRGLASITAGHELRDTHAQVLRPYLTLLRRGASLRTYLVILVEGIFLLGSFSYLGAALVARFGLSSLATGGVMTFFGIAAVVGGRTSAKSAARLGRPGTVALGLILAAIADAFVFVGTNSLVLTAVGVTLLGFGFMSAHSTMVTMVTEFAARARGVAMSLAPFSLMVGGAIGTQLGARIIHGSSFTTMYAVYGAGLLVLGLLALPALHGASLTVATEARESV